MTVTATHRRLMIVKRGYADISDATSVSTSPHQRTASSGRCQRRRKSQTKVGVWGGYCSTYVKLITKKKRKLTSHASASLSACLSISKTVSRLQRCVRITVSKERGRQKKKKKKKKEKKNTKRERQSHNGSLFPLKSHTNQGRFAFRATSV